MLLWLTSISSRYLFNSLAPHSTASPFAGGAFFRLENHAGILAH